MKCPKHPDRTSRKTCGFCERDARIAELTDKLKRQAEDWSAACDAVELQRDEARRIATALIDLTPYEVPAAQRQEVESWEDQT